MKETKRGNALRNVVNERTAAAAEDSAVDFAFLRAQTFGDAELEREVLGLFVAQARDLVPRLPTLSAADQAAFAHRLKGSCQGIGARAAAEAAERYGAAGPADRAARFRDLAAAFAAAEAAILARPTAT